LIKLRAQSRIIQVIKMEKLYREEKDCLNCGTILKGHFCHNCGQENLQIKESFGHMMNHAISDYFHFDHKFFHTLKPLLFKPGMLTNEYMAGRRTQYLHPVKMYIFISLVYFLVFFGSKHEVADFNTSDSKKPVAERVTDSVHKAPAKDIDSEKDKADSRGLVIFKSDQNSKDDDSTYAQYLAKQNKLPQSKRDGWLARSVIKKEFALQDPKVNKTQLITESINHNFPKMMFLLLPLFALMLKVTFWKSKKFYVEHLIYSFHLHCFVFLFMTIIMLLLLVMPASWHILSIWINIIAIITIIWYIYKSLKAVYHRSTFRTITKMIGLCLTYIVAFAFCMVLLVLITTVVLV